MSDKILILGGTAESAALAEVLTAQGADVTTSLAGRTKEPKPIAGKIRIGGFGGAEKMAEWIAENKITRLIDATHPFADKISKNAAQAARLADVVFEVRQRSQWEQTEKDNWKSAANGKAAAELIPTHARVFLALGSQHLEPFCHRDDVHFVIRMIDEPQNPLPFASYTLIAGYPAPGWVEEAKLLKEHQITHIVCRNSGGTGAYAKVEAARELELPVIMIARHL